MSTKYHVSFNCKYSSFSPNSHSPKNLSPLSLSLSLSIVYITLLLLTFSLALLLLATSLYFVWESPPQTSSWLMHCSLVSHLQAIGQHRYVHVNMDFEISLNVLMYCMHCFKNSHFFVILKFYVPNLCLKSEQHYNSICRSHCCKDFNDLQINFDRKIMFACLYSIRVYLNLYKNIISVIFNPIIVFVFKVSRTTTLQLCHLQQYRFSLVSVYLSLL